MILRQEALEHLAATISYLRQCSMAEAEPSAGRCLTLLEAWIQPADAWHEPDLSLLDAKGYRGSIRESGQIYGFCPHHLMPYWGTYQISFEPNEYIVGLASIGRVVDNFSHRALLQESLTQELGTFFFEHLQPHSLELRIAARHFCKELQAPNHCSSTDDFITCWCQSRSPHQISALETCCRK